MLKYSCMTPLLMLMACATVVGGTTDVVAVSSSPPGASCSVARSGAPVGSIASTPGIMSVSKSGSALQVSCSKPGYQTATASAPSSFNGLTFGNILVGGVVGVVIDASTGANFTYPQAVEVSMAPQPDTSRIGAPTPTNGVAPAPIPTLVMARMMALPDGAASKRSFLLGACSAGDATACILTQKDWPNGPPGDQRF